MSRTLAAACAVVLAFVGVACGDDSDDDRVGATGSSDSSPANDYFDALATNDLSRMDVMLELAAFDSPAYLYATHQIAHVRADAAGDVAAAKTEWSTDGVEMCQEGVDVSGDSITECLTFADFEVSDDGLLVDFTVNEVPLSHAIASGSFVFDAQGVEVRIVTAYQTPRGDVALNVEVFNGRPTPLTLAEYDWTYVTEDEHEVQSSDMSPGLGSDDIGPAATAETLVVFEQVPLGGRLRFVAFDWETDDRSDYEVRFAVSVPGGRAEQ
jgi:hypothetical protein